MGYHSRILTMIERRPIREVIQIREYLAEYDDRVKRLEAMVALAGKCST